MEKSPEAVPKKIRVVIVDDHPVVCHGLSQIITQDADMEVCAEAYDAHAGFDAIKKYRPDVAIIDISLKDLSGIDLIKWVVPLDLGVHMLVISIHDETVYAERALKAGAEGYLMKEESPDKILLAIRQILKGEVFVSDLMAKRMMRRIASGSSTDSGTLENLSDRELDVFRMIGKGIKPKQIADTLCLSIKTIETYQANLKEKLSLNNSFELTQYAIQWMKEN